MKVIALEYLESGSEGKIYMISVESPLRATVISYSPARIMAYECHVSICELLEHLIPGSVFENRVDVEDRNKYQEAFAERDAA